MIKNLSVLFFGILLMNCLNGQTLLTLKGGINWPSFREGQSSGNSQYKSYPSFCTGIDIKWTPGKTIFHWGGSFEYYLDKFDYGSLSGHQVEYTRFKIGKLRFSFYPELYLGNKLKVFANLGPFLSLPVYISSANSYSYTVDAGIKESLGIGYTVVKTIILSVEENGSFGFIGGENNWCLFLNITYVITKKTSNTDQSLSRFCWIRTPG
jgi:hypothetical protein